MIGPRTRPPLVSRIADVGRRLVMSRAEFEDRRVAFIHEEVGGLLSKDEIRRIVREHRLLD